MHLFYTVTHARKPGLDHLPSAHTIQRTFLSGQLHGMIVTVDVEGTAVWPYDVRVVDEEVFEVLLLKAHRLQAIVRYIRVLARV